MSLFDAFHKALGGLHRSLGSVFQREEDFSGSDDQEEVVMRDPHPALPSDASVTEAGWTRRYNLPTTSASVSFELPPGRHDSIDDVDTDTDLDLETLRRIDDASNDENLPILRLGSPGSMSRTSLAIGTPPLSSCNDPNPQTPSTPERSQPPALPSTPRRTPNKARPPSLPATPERLRDPYPSSQPPTPQRRSGGFRPPSLSFTPERAGRTYRLPALLSTPERPYRVSTDTQENVFESPSSANFFTNAQGFTIHEAKFITGDGNHIEAGVAKGLLDCFKDHIASGAEHNSDERCDAPRCHPHTRTAVQEDILSWIIHGESDDEPKPIMWVTGPAGTGKTAIAGSVAETCEEEDLLAASFFFSSFSGSEKRRSKRCLIATLAWQLSQHDSLRSYADSLLLAIQRDPTIFRKRLKYQAEALILRPLREVLHDTDTETIPKVIIVDGLDEVEAEQSTRTSGRKEKRSHEDEQVEILQVLTDLCTDPMFPSGILIVSRREPIINDFFTGISRSYSLRLFLDSKYLPDADIKLFIKSKFADIRRRYGLSPSWPGQKAVDWIVENASGQFIFAATVARYVGDPGKPPPQVRLNQVLKLDLALHDGTNPFAPLDALYRHVLSSSPDPLSAIKWMCAIKYFSFDHDRPSSFWRRFLETIEGETTYLLGNLASLISIPPTNDDTSPIIFYHKSLFDFLSSQERCQDLFLEQSQVVSFFTARCLEIMKCKGPLGPGTQEQRAIFLGLFLQFGTLTSVWRTSWHQLSTAFAANPAAYDVAWLTRICLTQKPTCSSPSSTLYSFFRDVHARCPL